MRQQRLDPESSSILTENKKYLVFVSLFVVGIVLTFIGVVTLSLFTISFGFTFILFSLLLYKLLPASKYAPRSMMDRGRASMTLSPRSHHPYILSASGDATGLSFALPPPPPSYQEAVNSAQLIQSLDPMSLQHQFATVSPHANTGRAVVGQRLSHSRNVSSSNNNNNNVMTTSSRSVDEVTVTGNSLPVSAEPTIVTIESGASHHHHVRGLQSDACDVREEQRDHPHHESGNHVTISTGDGSAITGNNNNNNNRLHFITIIEATI